MTFDIFVRYVLIPAMGVTALLVLVAMGIEAVRERKFRRFSGE